MTTATAKAVDRSTLRLSEVARHVVVPEGIDRSLWLGWDGQPGVEERVREFGFTFDKWQDGLAQVALGVTALGVFVATVGGIILSIPRQVAKTFMTMVIVLALCSMFPNLTALWTAHRSRLSTQTFRKMKALARSKAMRKYILPGPEGVRSTNGEQEIRFRNGSVIMFGAREHGFGLGFDEVDIEVFDEAQRLTSNALDDMVAATNQSRWSFGALLFFMGTPPRPTDEGEEFTNRRVKALAVKAAAGIGDFGGVAVGGEAVYVECSADPNTGAKGGPHINDREQVRIANPSYPHRTPEMSVQRLREQLTNDDSWRREGLGIWDDDTVRRPFNMVQWRNLAVDEKPDGESVFGVAFSADGFRMSLGAAVQTGDVAHLELLDPATYDGSDGDEVGGLTALVRFFCEKDDAGVPRWRRSRIVIAGQAGAHVLKQMLTERHVPERRITLVTSPQYLAACGLLEESVKAGTVTHLRHGQSVLDDTVAAIQKDKRGGWTLPDGDETPVEAVSLALWGARAGRKPRDPGVKRKAVIL